MRTNYFKNPTRKRFTDAFPQFKKDSLDTSSTSYFLETWLTSPFYDSSITESEVEDIYYHLYARYYDSHYIYPDDKGIALNTMEIIHDYYPNLKERLNIIKQLRDMGIEEFAKSGISINSMGSNPKIETEMDSLIDLVDSQSASFQLKSQEQTLKAKFYALKDGLYDEFLDRFKRCFVKLYGGVSDYIYENEEE